MKAFFFFLFVFLFSQGFGQNFNCKSFQEGKFVYQDKLGNEVQVTRTKDKQIEYYDYIDVTMEFKIEWIKPCTYVITYEKIKGIFLGAESLIGESTEVQVIEKLGKDFKVSTKSDGKPYRVYYFKRVG
jgi:hypothetical protein